MLRSKISFIINTIGLLFCFSFAAQAAVNERVALVIGNSEYTSVPKLKNPKNDSEDIAQTLSGLGFVVQIETDLDQSQLLGALRNFQRKARGSEIALIYYAGHGIEMGKQNYLIPTDALLETDSDILFEAVPLENAVLAAEGARTLSLVIVDACRNNPFASQIQRTSSNRSIGRGLAKIEPQGNTLIAYAAKDGTVARDGEGRNSPYAEALIAALSEPRLEVGLMFRKVRDMVLETTGNQQEPFFYGSLSSKKLFLNKTEVEKEVVVAAAPAVVAAPAPTTAAPRRDLELNVASLIWEGISKSKDPRDFQDFLSSYPNSPFAPYAKRALDRLVSADTAVVVDPVKSTTLLEAPVPPKVDVGVAGKIATDEPITATRPTRVALPSENTDLAMLEPPKQSVENGQVTAPQADTRVVSRKLTRDELREVQERLTIIKYKPGPIDGLMGNRTRTAISAYQKDKQISETGEASLVVLQALREDVSQDSVLAFRAEQQKRRAAWAAAQRKKKAQAAAAAKAQAAANAELARRQAEAAAAAAAAQKPKRKRRILEATDDDRSSGGGSSGGGGGGGGTCSGIC